MGTRAKTPDAALVEKRNKLLREEEDRASALAADHGQRLQNALLYRQLHACGMRITDIDRIVTEELRKRVPA